MKLKVVVSALVATACVAGSGMAQSTNVNSVNVVGYFKLDVPASSRQIMAVPMTKIPDIRGVIAGNSTTTITVNETLTAGRYNWGASGVEARGNSYFFIEVTQTNSPFVGRHMYITNNTASILTIKDGLPTDISAGNLANCSYKIISANRVRDIFGETNSPSLQGGYSAIDPAADNVRTWLTSGGGMWDSPIHFHTSGDPTAYINRWLQVAVPCEDKVIDRDEAFLLARNAATATNLTIAGEVSANSQNVIAGVGNRMFSGGMSVIDVLIGQSGLTNAVGFHGGYSALDPAATVIRKWLAAGGGMWDAPVHFHTSGDPTAYINRWLQVAVPVDTNYFLKAGEGFLISNPSGLNWERTSPLQ